MKRTISFALTIAMVISLLSFSGSARGAEDTIDSNLISRGIPAYVVERMSDDTKELIYADQALIYGGSSCLNYDEETGEYHAVGAISPHGNIDDDDLQLTFTTLYSTNPFTGELTSIRIAFDYEWLNTPNNRWDDPIAISWDDTSLRMDPGTFYRADYIDYRDPFTGVSESELVSSSIAPAKSFNAGVYWFAELSTVSSYYITESLHGHGTFTLEPSSFDGIEELNTIIYGYYIHKLADVSLSINIPQFGALNVSGGNNNYDEMTITENLLWR